MARRRFTIKRLDPWSLMKFGFLMNLALLLAGLVAFGVLWLVVSQLGLIATACQIAEQLGFQNCGINGGNLFRALVLLGLLGVIVVTGLLVFFSFLFNLIADLVGGVQATVLEESPGRPARTASAASASDRGSQATGRKPPGSGLEATRAVSEVGASLPPRSEPEPQPQPEPEREPQRQRERAAADETRAEPRSSPEDPIFDDRATGRS